MAVIMKFYTACYMGFLVAILAHLLLFAGANAEDKNTIAMMLHPASPEPNSVPFRLLPTESQMRDGNAAPVMLRMVYEQTLFMETHFSKVNELADLDYSDPAIKDFPFDSFYRQLSRASTIRDADWEYPLDSDRPWEIRLPDAQSMRQFAGRGLKIWINQRIAEDDLQSALEGVRVQLACARHIGRPPILVNQLIASAIAQVAVERLEVIASNNDSENIYGALALLPQMLVDVRTALQWEAGFLRQGLPSLGSAVPPIGSPRWKQIAGEFISLMETVVTQRYSPQESEALAKKISDYAERQLNEDQIFTVSELSKMTDEEKVMRWTLRINDQFNVRAELAFFQPASQAIAELLEIESAVKKIERDSGAPGIPFLPNGPALYVALHRFDRMVRLLQTFESIRDYAKNHNGALPENLQDLDLPAPLDPMTLTSFRYDVEGQTATLRWNEIPNMPNEPVRTYLINAGL